MKAETKMRAVPRDRATARESDPRGVTSSDPGAQWAELLSQASLCRDFVRFHSLARRSDRLARQFGPPPGQTSARIALLGGASTELIERPMRLALRIRGIEPELYVAPYNVFLQEMLEADSGTSRFAPQIAMVMMTAHNVPAWPRPGCDADTATELARSVCRRLYDASRSLHDRCNTEVVLSTLPSFSQQPIGNLSAKSPDDANNFIRRLNVLLGDMAPSYVHVHDVAALVERLGLDRWFDARLWHEAKQPVAPACIPDFSRSAAAVIGAILGKSRKCLILDLDNTLWGGVVGDDGVEGLELGEGSAVGEAFKAFQSYVKALKQRGILLAVCSKNDEKQAVRPFDEHPEMVLRRDDFVAFRANWEPKSDNIAAIAQELDIGLDALVFVDDNPAERAQVRHALPLVAVPDITADPTEYPAILDAARYFEVTTITEEDRRRSDMYRDRGVIGELQASTTDLAGFLASLDMTAVVRLFEPVSFARITQLVNKSNQFNLTTKRLTGAQVESMAADPAWFTRTVRLTDCFGDHGLISVLFGGIESRTLNLEGWLMSCRVLKRGVERLLLNEVVAAAGRGGIEQIVGTYVPTDRNGLVENHYRDLGFDAVDENGGVTTWRLTIADYQPLETWIALDTREGHDDVRR